MIDDRGDVEGSPPEPEILSQNESREGSSFRYDDSQPKSQRIHLLEIELRRIRKEASAARLDARAAEIELMIRRLSETGRDSLGFQSWNEVREALQHSKRATDLPQQRVSQPLVRFDGPGESHHHLDRHATPAMLPDTSATDASTDPTEVANSKSVDAGDEEVSDSVSSEQPVDKSSEASIAQQLDAVFHDPKPLSREAAALAAKLELNEEELDADRSIKKSRPKAMIVSAILHALVLLLLAGWTLTTHKPKDQVSISASTTSASSEESMETFTLDASEPEVEPTEPTESETEYELSPIGEISVTEFSADIAPAPPAPSAASMMSSNSASSSAAAAMSLNTFSDAKIQFCGVEGGGNHFVYLVDSSGSMGSSFDSARQELLNSIDFLKPDQRFYVIFFDAKPDFMRLANSAVDEPRSVEATPENKLALKRWAMRISQDIGKNPHDVLEFALTLRPDVIFLLSDGEFPQRVEDLLLEKNRVENLFGDSGPMCIVHTIGYYSKEGEVRMRRIAEKNGGQYRHVPRP